MSDKRDKTQSKAKKPSLYIRTFGCQMNFRDSEFVEGILLEDDFRKASSISDADIILFNSCSVRKHAEDRLFSNIADLKKLKAKRPNIVIGLMGCTAQSHKEKVFKISPLVDFVCGTGNESDIPKLIEKVLKDRCPIIAVNKVNEKRLELFPKYRAGNFKAYVSIGEGCDNYCSYCIVPYVRGRERSRDPKDIVKEVKELASRGFKEIMLLGQNVNSYKDEKSDGKGQGFVKLLEKINKIDGIERIRFMTSHPKDASIELFKAIRSLDKVCEHLHLPIQSGSDRILKLMNRKYTSGKYLKLADSYRRIVPGGNLTTDIIVGFPSETKADFDKTMRIVKKIGFDGAYAFKYSPRPPARSSELKDDIPACEKDERLQTLLALHCEISRKRNERMVGSIADILVDGCNGKDDSLLAGRTRTNVVTVFKADRRLIGKIVNVKIDTATPHTLKGRIMR